MQKWQKLILCQLNCYFNQERYTRYSLGFAAVHCLVHIQRQMQTLHFQTFFKKGRCELVHLATGDLVLRTTVFTCAPGGLSMSTSPCGVLAAKIVPFYHFLCGHSTIRWLRWKIHLARWWTKHNNLSLCFQFLFFNLSITLKIQNESNFDWFYFITWNKKCYMQTFLTNFICDMKWLNKWYTDCVSVYCAALLWALTVMCIPQLDSRPVVYI